MEDNAQRRYARHIVLPEIGEMGQEKLLASSALVIGAGGLGSSVLASLASAGVGRLGIVEPDRVELSNLQRQHLFETGDIGRLKAEAARDRIHEVNPDCKVELFPQRFDAQNGNALVRNFFSSPFVIPAQAGILNDLQDPCLRRDDKEVGMGVVIDCSDNFATRFGLSEACFKEKKTLISAAISGFSGQLSTFKPYLGGVHPCYRCLVPEMPAREISCAQEGIVGPLAGMMGSMQALEAIKELLGIGTSLSGFLLIADALTADIRKVTLPKDPACPFCQKQP